MYVKLYNTKNRINVNTKYKKWEILPGKLFNYAAFIFLIKNNDNAKCSL